MSAPHRVAGCVGFIGWLSWLARWPKELVESGYARSVDHMQPAKLAEKTHSFIHQHMHSANQSDAYSTLYPDTSSDSASGKSNGLRFVSPNAARNQHPARSGQTAANITILCPVSPVKTESRTVPVNATSNINRKLRHTSYAAAWLTARKLPSKPNLPLPAKLPDSTMPHGPMVLNNHNRSMPSQ